MESHLCSFRDCDAGTTRETGAVGWLVLESPGRWYERYFFCPTCREILQSEEELSSSLPISTEG
jgi:hypothetical protein